MPAKGSRGFQIVPVLLAFILLFTSACKPSTPQPGPAAPGATSAPAGDLDDGPASITFAINEYEARLYEPLIEQFMAENPDITLQIVEPPTIGPDDQTENVNWWRLMASASDTTIIWGGSMDPNQSNYFRDLGPLMDMDPTFDADDFWPGALDACTDAEGRVLGIPLNFTINGVFFDEEAFDAAGLPHPGPGWTFEDLQKAVRALTERRGDQTRYGLAERESLYSSIVAPFVVTYLLEQSDQPDGEELEALLDWYLSLAKEDLIYSIRIPEDWSKSWEEWTAMFSGDARPAMWLGSLAESLPTNGPVAFNPDDPFSFMAFKTDGFAPYPIDPERPELGTTPVFPMCIAISSGSLHPRAAWAWINFLSKQVLVMDEYNTYERLRVPARISVTESSGYWDVLPKEVGDSVRYAIEHAWISTYYPETFSAVEKAIVEAIHGGADFSTSLESALAEIVKMPTPTPDTVEVVVATPPPPPPEDATIVKFMMQNYSPDSNQLIKEMITAFQQSHPDIYIDLSTDVGNTGSDPIDDWYAFLGERFDCYAWWPTYSNEVTLDSALSLNALIEAEGPEFIQDFPADQLDAFREGGELYGLPAFTQPRIFRYNIDLLEKRGVEPPGLDWTMDDFVEMISKVASTSASDPSYGMLYSTWEDILLSGRGVKWLDLSKDPPEPMFDSPDMISGLAWITDLMQSNAVLLQDDSNWQTVDEALRTGQVGFWLGQVGYSDWFMYSGSGNQPAFRVGVAPLPTMPGGDDWASTYNTLNTQGLFISATTENARACWDWMKFLTEQPNAFAGVPSRISVAESQAYKALVGEQTAEVYLAAVRGSAKPDPNQSAFGPLVWPMYEWRVRAITAVLGGEDPEEVLIDTQQKAEDFLACAVLIDQEGKDDMQLTEEVYDCARQADPQGNWPVYQ